MEIQSLARSWRDSRWQDVSFHCLRHTFGTQLAATGKRTPFDVQRLMRHRNITTSMIYVNLANEDLPSVDF
jgi:integrase